MSTENNNVEPQENDLDAFSAAFFGQKQADPEPASSEAIEDETEESDAPEDTQNSEDDNALADEDDDSDEDSGEETDETDPEPQPKKKNRFQERIDELTTARREAEREAERLRKDFEELKRSLENKTEKTDTSQKVQEDNLPDPAALNEDGSPKYELGEFDPKYQADLVKSLFEQERKNLEAEAAQKAEAAQIAAQRQALEAEWTEKLGPAQERYPDFMQKGQQLVESFSGIDAAYGEYLTATLMSMEYGPDVLYYLASNPDEAQKIINSGPTKATIALGRLESKFLEAEQEKQKARPKVSKAPEPPAHRTKGSAAAVLDVPPDTDNLDDFSKVFFKK